jgi:integrase
MATETVQEVKKIELTEKGKTDYSKYNLSEDDFKKMLGASDVRERAILLLMGRSALRVSEVCNLRVRNIDFSKKSVLLEYYKGVGRYKKTAEELTIPLTSECLTLLKNDIIEKEGLGQDDYIFFSNWKGERHKTPISRQQVEQIIGNIGVRAGINNPIPTKETTVRYMNGKVKTYQTYARINSHLLRHTAVRFILEKNPDDYRLAQKIARHSSVSLTLNTYGQMSEKDKLDRFHKTVG